MNDNRIPWGGGATEPSEPGGGGAIGSPGVIGAFDKQELPGAPAGERLDVSVTLGGYELVNPWFFNQSTAAQYLRCKPNGFRNTRGSTPGHGAVLMTKSSVDSLMADIAASSNHLTSFTISDGTADGIVTYERLQVYNIISISGGLAPSDEEVFLVEFEDVRRSLTAVPIDLCANITHFRNAIPSSTTQPIDPLYYYQETLTFSIPGRINADAAWTFDDIIEYCFYTAELRFPFISTQDIPTPAFSGNQGFCSQNIYAYGSMWKLLCDLGMRSMFFFTMNPDGSLNFVDPQRITTTIRDFLADYNQYLVYTDNNDVYEDYIRTNTFWPMFPGISTGVNHVFRQPYSFTGSKTNSIIGNNKPALINTKQPVPADQTSGSDTPVGGWIQLIQKWTQDYADRYEQMNEKNPPFVRSYAKVINVDMETGVEIVHHDCQGIGPNGEGGMFTHVQNNRVEFDPHVVHQDIEHFRQWYRPPIMVRSSNAVWGQGENDIALTSIISSYGGPKNELSAKGYDEQTDFDVPSGVNLAGRFGTYLTMVYDPNKDEYELLDRNHRDERCPLIRFTNAGLVTGIVTSGVVVQNYGPGVPATIGSTVTISNPLSREMDAGGMGLAYWDNQNGYVFLDGEEPA